MRNLEKRLSLHNKFWNGTTMEEPIASYRIGDYFFANKFKANLPLLERGRRLYPEMIDVNSYLDDYERTYQKCESIGQSAFFTVEPCIAIPWIEGMVGCPIIGSEVSFVSKHIYESINDIGEIFLSKENPWFLKYLEFLDKLEVLSAGRFPVGQPIMRGMTDVIGAMVGESELACATMTDPDVIHKAFHQVSKMLRDIIEAQYLHVHPFYSGFSAGFYHIWAPGKIIWYQDDLSAILSKSHFDEYLRENSEFICSGYNYSFVHIHPSSFFYLDGILSLKNLKAVEINKDVGGPSIAEMLSVFRQVINANKRLIIWGDLSPEEVTMVMEELPHKGLFLNIITPTVEDAGTINDIITTKWKS